jgi:signal transduction histidine kinase
MTALKQILRGIPCWAYLFVLLVIFVNAVYLIYRYKLPETGESETFVNGYWIIDQIKPGGPVSKAGIRIGDTIVSCNSYPLDKWSAGWHGQMAGDTLIVGILRNNQEIGIPVITVSNLSSAPWVLWPVYIIILLFCTGSLYLFVKKPNDKAIKLFFIYIQFLTLFFNSKFLPFHSLLSVFANVFFLVSVNLYGTVLVHFHLLFPKPSLFYLKFKPLPSILYGAGILCSVILSVIYIRDLYISTNESYRVFEVAIKYSLYWTTATFLFALFVAFYQYITIKSTLARNQVLLLFIGSFFVFIPAMLLTFRYEWLAGLPFAYTLETSQAASNLILVLCILVAIFRYHIWDIEVFIRKALLYACATIIIILTYLLLIWITDRLAARETNFTRFLTLGVSVIVFLVLRDRIQRLIDRIFHRETYDSANVVSDFEEKLAGVYQFDKLKLNISQGLDEIFHFKSFVFNLKKKGLMYEIACFYGINDQMINQEYEITVEMEEKLSRTKVFSPEELDKRPRLLEISNGELIVPLVLNDQPNGFFICGQKKSERTYSMQDIRVLRLLARRVNALFQTATLYQKDLDRQLMLERERARISQDMHDDIGASLTRISMMSDLVKNRTDVGSGAKQWLGLISDTSRGLMEEMSQIIWALNPKNDNLEGLVAYIRRFAFEYFEPTEVSCEFNFPGELPNYALSVEVRRNVYLVVREALHNVVKHSCATKVWISAEMNQHEFRIWIKDNGNGFDPGKPEFPGNGLVNMKRRINDIGGEFVITSKAGKGTEIALEITLKGDTIS